MRGTTPAGDMALHRRLATAALDLTRWHLRSQEVARRNAMVASTALTQRRRELLEVEEFLAVHKRQHAVRHRSA